MSHIHNAYQCPRHVGGCGIGCECPDRDEWMCNPYHVSGYCPDDLAVMEES